MLDICFVFCDIQREIVDYFENNQGIRGRQRQEVHVNLKVK